MKTEYSSKIIAVSCIAIIGYFANFILFYVEYNLYNFGYILELLNFLKPNTGLGFFMTSINPWSNFFKHHIYLLDLALGILTILSVIQYILSQKRKFNLLAFTFSIIIFSSIVNVLLYVTVLVLPDLENSNFILNNFVHTKYFILTNFIWLFTSFYILKKLTNKYIDLIKLEITHTKVGYKRFSFYPILDFIVAMLILTPLLMLYIGSSLHFLETIGLVKVSFIIMGIISVFIYNLFFDNQFGFTPARLLSGNLLLNKNLKNLSIKDSIVRTYNNISFKEKDENMEYQLYKIIDSEPKSIENKYLILFAILIVALGLILNNMFEKFEYKLSQYQSKENEFKFISSNLNYLDSSTIIQYTNSDYSNELFMKINKIENDSIKANIITVNKKYIKSVHQIQDIFINTNNDSLINITIPKSDLDAKHVGMQYSEYFPCKDKVKIKYLNAMDSFCIKFVYNSTQPSLHLDHAYIISVKNSEKTVELIIDNFGTVGFITDIKSTEGEAKLLNKLPLKIDSPKNQVYSIRVQFQITDYWEKIRLEFSVNNDLLSPKNKQKYVVYGNIYALKMDRIK